MAPIIRSPALADQKHSLRATPRAAAHALAQPAAAVAVPTPAAAATKPVASSAPAMDEQAMEREIQRRVAEREQAIRAELGATLRKEMQQALQQELEANRDAAAQAGHAEGLEQAKAQVAEAQARQAQQLAQLMDGMAGAYQSDVSRIEAEAAAIAFEAVCKIAGSQLLGPDAVKAIVAQAIAPLRQNQRFIVRVSPQDFALLQQHGEPDLLAQYGWKADERIRQGGCVIETELGELDARLETQLQAFRDVLLSVGSNPRPL